MNQISVIMPCYNRSQDLRRTLIAYQHQTGDAVFEIIAVDDGSTDSTYAEISSFSPNRFALHPIRLDENQGPAYARNRGLIEVKSPLVLFVGDDIIPAPDFIQNHIEAHQAFPQLHIAILGKVQWPDDLPVNTLMAHIDGIGAQQFSYSYFKNQHEYDFRHFYTANISIKKDFLLTESQLFDTGFPYAAFEDVELAYRLSKRGLKIIYLSSPLGFHYHYHNIWTFTTRQYRAGLMAIILVKKHICTSGLILGRRWILKLILSSFNAFFQNRITMDLAELEKNMLLKLSSYEWSSHHLLDHFYLKVLEYFYHKGLIHGIMGESSNLMHKVLHADSHKIYSSMLSKLGN